MSSFSIKMSPSFDRMHPLFAVAFFPCELFYLLVYSFAVYSIVGSYFLSYCVLIQCPLASLHLFLTCLSSSLYFFMSALAFLLSSVTSKISGVVHFLSFFRFVTGMCSFADSSSSSSSSRTSDGQSSLADKCCGPLQTRGGSRIAFWPPELVGARSSLSVLYTIADSNILCLNICHLSSAMANRPSALNSSLTLMLYLFIILSFSNMLSCSLVLFLFSVAVFF